MIDYFYFFFHQISSVSSFVSASYPLFFFCSFPRFFSLSLPFFLCLIFYFYASLLSEGWKIISPLFSSVSVFLSVTWLISQLEGIWNKKRINIITRVWRNRILYALYFLSSLCRNLVACTIYTLVFFLPFFCIAETESLLYTISSIVQTVSVFFTITIIRIGTAESVFFFFFSFDDMKVLIGMGV